ncbi:MAG: M4 family metallopeptidase [Clostridiales bacterium]|nr:M4 family metallopeptidase [Clostridiales bacterium]
MKDRKMRALAILLAMSILGAACSKKETTTAKTKKDDNDYEKHKMETKDPDEETEPSETTEPSQRDSSVRFSPTLTPTPEVIPILTEQDIQDMNGGNALIIRNDEGNVSTIVGRYFHRPVADHEDAIDAIRGLQELLGIENGYFPFIMYGETFQGYTYYTYRQIKGDLTVENATLKVVLDPEGYPCMLQSSLETHLDVVAPTQKINEADAEQIVLNRVGSGYQVFSEYTMKTCFVDDYHETRHCFEVITNNPDGSISFDMPYVIHFVDYDGSYVKSYPTSYLPTDQLADYGNDSYFKDMEATERTYTVNRNGESFTFSVPISYNSVDGKYYLADPERNIICADFYEFEYNGHNLVFESSDDPNNWSENHLITYYNYIKSYDFYATFNVYSTDGFGMPMLILMGYCESDGTPVDNACNMGVVDGWSIFGASDANTYCYSLDVCAHEFTHGVSGFARQGNIYANEYGSINEAFSDIMGNICEMYMGETSDTNWLLGETSGNTMRSMSNPYMYNQPMYLADPYYIAPSRQGLYGVQDNGGVHINNTLISYLCYKLYQNGMSLYDLAHFFLCAMEMHTPTADYDDLYGIFVAAAQLSGNEAAIPIITQHWQDTLLAGDRSKNAENCAINGYQRINVPFASEDVAVRCIVSVYYASTGSLALQRLAQPDGVASFLIPADGSTQFIFVIEEYSDEFWSSQIGEKGLDSTGAGWTTDANSLGIFTMDSGDIATLPIYS